MDSQVSGVPHPTPEGKLIRRVRSLAIPKLGIAAAGARIGLSPEQWGYVERGYYPARSGNPPRPFSAPAATLAKMAYALQISPDRLETEGQRPDAATVLREILRDQHQPAAQDSIPEAVVIVPMEWYEQAKALEAMAIEAIESGGFSIGSMEILKERYRAQADALRQGRRRARLGRRDPRVVHHIDGDPYNNDPANLVIVDPSENSEDLK